MIINPDDGLVKNLDKIVAREDRRQQLAKKLRQQIQEAKTSERLQTLVKRLHMVTGYRQKFYGVGGMVDNQHPIGRCDV